MEFQQVVAARRSVRKFSDREVPHDVLRQVLAVALQAPSSRNCRSTRFLVVRKPEIVHRMAGMRDYGAAPLAADLQLVEGLTDRKQLPEMLQVLLQPV